VKRVKCVDTVGMVSARVNDVSCNFLSEMIALCVGNSFAFIGFREEILVPAILGRV
jgi:hypothetical protein